MRSKNLSPKFPNKLFFNWMLNRRYLKFTTQFCLILFYFNCSFLFVTNFVSRLIVVSINFHHAVEIFRIDYSFILLFNKGYDIGISTSRSSPPSTPTPYIRHQDPRPIIDKTRWPQWNKDLEDSPSTKSFPEMSDTKSMFPKLSQTQSNLSTKLSSDYLTPASNTLNKPIPWLNNDCQAVVASLKKAEREWWKNPPSSVKRAA